MNVKKLSSFAVLSLFAASIFGAPANASDKTARPTTEFFQKSVVYQILPQHFTQEGTLAKAAEFLPHIKSLGMDIVYLCPIVESDDDGDTRFWSKRQKASGLNNPRNPYRMKDYFKIDPRFGTDKDLKNFVEQAHALGLKVVLDLVYYHCGPKAVFIETNPDFVVRDADGKVKNGRWSFPELNFKSRGLRDYLIKNMEYFVEKFDVDGYRTDVEPSVPADFWAEAYTRIAKIKPDVIMIAEGERKDAQVDAYDANYSFKWEYGIINVFQGKKPRRLAPQNLGRSGRGVRKRLAPAPRPRQPRHRKRRLPTRQGRRALRKTVRQPRHGRNPSAELYNRRHSLCL